jgi:putative acetyltransferase
VIVLREGGPADAEVLGPLFTASRQVLDFLPVLHTPEEDRAFIAGHILPNFRIMVAELDGRIAGYMAEAPNWIEQLYLAPDLLRQGIGSALITSAQSRHDWLELWCFAQNRRGRAFYERHGFVAIAETDGSGNEEGAPDIRYRWEVDAQSSGKGTVG